jgi:hypothetical protein
LSEKINVVSRDLLDILARIEMGIGFSDDEIFDEKTFLSEILHRVGAAAKKLYP